MGATNLLDSSLWQIASALVRKRSGYLEFFYSVVYSPYRPVIQVDGDDEPPWRIKRKNDEERPLRRPRALAEFSNTQVSEYGVHGRPQYRQHLFLSFTRSCSDWKEGSAACHPVYLHPLRLFTALQIEWVCPSNYDQTRYSGPMLKCVIPASCHISVARNGRFCRNHYLHVCMHRGSSQLSWKPHTVYWLH